MIESIKKNQYKYSPLVSDDIPPYESCPNDYIAYSHDRPTYFDTKAMLAEEAEKMYEVLSNDLADEILAGYIICTSQPPPPMFVPSNDPNEGRQK